MSSKLLAVWEHARGSYWFLPSLMASAAICLSFLGIMLDGMVGPEWLDQVGWLYTNKPEGARTLLGTIAGSMIGVAGVTFSIAIAAFAQATTQFGPRLINNFMRDTGNQLVLGTFVATFVYSLMILRTIQASSDTSPAFVPHLSIALALLLALGSVGVLIFFIHHVPESINVSNMIATLGRDLADKLNKLAEVEPLRSREDLAELRKTAAAEGHSVESRGAGYVQRIAEDLLFRTAEERDIMFVVRVFPGDFVRPGEPLGWLHSAHEPDAALQERLSSAFIIESQRSPTQDLLFLVDELVEVAARALSPGVNDVFTAIGCMDWLSHALRAAAQRDFPIIMRENEEGKLRVVGQTLTFGEILDRACDRLRPYAERDPNAASYFLAMLGATMPDLRDTEQKARIREQAEALLAGVLLHIRHERDLRRIETGAAKLTAAAQP